MSCISPEEWGTLRLRESLGAEPHNRPFWIAVRQMSILVHGDAADHNRTMDYNPKYFDKIRIRKPGQRKEEPATRKCQWEGCEQPGTHKAPLGRDREGQYVHFCFDHVREYNKSYNFFSGLDDDAISKFQKDALTGHRPTWTIGVNKWGRDEPAPMDPRAAMNPRVQARLNRANKPQTPQSRRLRSLEAKAFDDLRLPHSATPDEIKSRYKELVKRHHPDANGGDRSSEERLRQIIQAYKFLRQAGFC